MSEVPTKVVTPEVMWAPARIAERDGVTREAVLKLARDYVEDHDLTVERDARGRIATINVVAYDLIRSRVGDPSKAQTRQRPVAPKHLTELNSYDEALRQKTWHEAEKRRLELAELKGALIRKDRLQAAILTCGEEIVRVLDRLPQAANDLSIAVAKDGEHGLRTALKALASRLRADVAAALTNIAAGSPAQDEDGAGGAAGGE
ncbi:hypothetical protein AEGHOMDF_4508 [Methylobacterium soli]|nr:hypothetical protein AEGHOMDF_4508 [Methylobacterium soli]